MKNTSVLIVDDHAVLRSGLQLLINSQPDMKVVAEAGDAAQAVRVAREHQADVVVLDVGLPGGSGILAIGKIHEASPKSRALILSMHDDPGSLRAALECGAAGYVAKRATDSELINAIRTVSEGRAYVSVSLVGNPGLQDLLSKRPARNPSAAADPLALLSQREKQVLTLLAWGHTNQEAADQLGVSVKSIETYRRRLFEKLGFSGRAELVRFALGIGLIGSESGPVTNTGQ